MNPTSTCQHDAPYYSSSPLQLSRHLPAQASGCPPLGAAAPARPATAGTWHGAGGLCHQAAKQCHLQVLLVMHARAAGGTCLQSVCRTQEGKQQTLKRERAMSSMEPADTWIGLETSAAKAGHCTRLAWHHPTRKGISKPQSTYLNY